jgi:hypothetical protein
MLPTDGDSKPIERRTTVYYNDPDVMRLLARERIEQRLAEADAARLAREVRGITAARPRRLRISVGLTLGTIRRAARPGLEA